MRLELPAIALICLCLATPAHPQEKDGTRRWLAGDHHVHSIYSARYEADPAQPDAPSPLIGGDSVHPILLNARMAQRFGLDWMVSTDHGGPLHSRLNFEQAWPDLVAVRRAMPDLMLFYGMEFDVPGGEHASLILPTNDREGDVLREIESRFGKREVPNDPPRNTRCG